MTSTSTVSIVGLCLGLGLAGLTAVGTNDGSLGISEIEREQQWLLVDAERDEGEPRRPGDGVNRFS
ncbi:MAG: hypothetical protein SWY16_08020 [Cyanobacteriota bacterium]|nr:hypothetical protein [Cyanobacteriota bacterium]